MIPSAFDYERATSVDDAVARLAAAGGAGKLIAGGHSLVPLMKLRLNEPGTLIDIARIPELAGIREADGAIEIGAGTVHHAVATSPLLRERCPVVAETAATIGDPQVRNRGTLGGSIAHADPAADYPATLLALDAEVRIQGPRGARTVAARDFFQDLFTVDLAGDELITAVRFAPGARRRLRQALPARLALRHRRGGGGPRHRRRRRPQRPPRADGRPVARGAPDRGRAGAGGSGGRRRQRRPRPPPARATA